VVKYSGDSNEDNQALIRYRRVGDPSWLVGHEMMVDRFSGEWRVSLVHLHPDTRFEVQVLFSDPDGVSTGIVEGVIKTRVDYPVIGQPLKIFYVPDDGDLQSVVAEASPGDTVRIRSGTYYTDVLLDVANSGEKGAYVTIEAEPGERVILDGSDPSINDQNLDNWRSYNDSVFFTDLSWGDKGCSDRTLPGYVGENRGGEGVRYLLYEGLEDWNEFLSSPPGSAYYDCAQRLYVKTYDEDDPDNLEMHVSRLRNGIVLAGADYIRIRNLEFRYYGIYGVYFSDPGADNNVIEQNTFHGIGVYHIRIGHSSTPGSSDNLIQDNHFYENGYRDSGWTWSQQYKHAASISIRLLDAGPGNVIRRNTFTGGTDAISVVNQSHHTDIYENEIFDCMDDGIEVDNEPGQNIRVWGNSVLYCYSGISNQDWFTGGYEKSGPVYIFRNVIAGGDDPLGRSNSNDEIYYSAYAFKVGTDLDRLHHVYYYHNTIVIPDSDKNGNGIQDAGGRYFSGVKARNNLWNMTRFVYNLRWSGTIQNHDFDCDSLYSSSLPDGNAFIQWSRDGGPDGDGKYNNLSDFQTITGQELNGIIGGENTISFYHELRYGNPEIDKGCVIIGFNDRGPWKYLGTKPDIGAYEHKPFRHLFVVSQFLRTWP
jgi:hypothetical protein